MTYPSILNRLAISIRTSDKMILLDQTVFLICLGTGILGSMAGIVGCWLFLQHKSLFGDTISHATFPGITAVFFLTHVKHPALLLGGGLCSALMGAYCIQTIQQQTTLKKDTVLGIILASSFGIGTIILSKIQSMTDAHQAGLSKYLLGNPATMMHEDIVMIVVGSIITLALTVRFILPYSIILFDETYAKTVGIPASKLSWIMLIPTTVTIVFGLQAVGIILMSALLINPAAAAYQWTKNFITMMLLAAFFGASCAIIGTFISCSYQNLSTGPIIVIVATTITALSILFSPQGMIISWYKNLKKTQQLNQATLLSRFLLFNEGKQDPYHAHNIAALVAVGKSISKKNLLILQEHGFIETPAPNFWRLTPQGVQFLDKASQKSNQ